MFISALRHNQDLASLSVELASKDAKIAALEQRIDETERTRHELIEKTRYAIEAAGYQLSETDRARGEQLSLLGHVLPYLLSRRRHWDDPYMPEVADTTILHARHLAAEYGFDLPADPVLAVKAMLDLALSLFSPSLTLPLEGLSERYPLNSQSS